MNMVQGLVFNIVRGSFVDGHGVRTTVFLKGCPLRCLWCCNVEGQSVNPELKVTSEDCNGCGQCVPCCHKEAIYLQNNHANLNLIVDRRKCDDCGKCIEACYTGALGCFGQYYSVNEMMALLLCDEPYYRSSGGGVTIGGGEPTYQAEFTYELIKQCHKSNLHIALDTCGYTLSELGFRCLSEADLLLYDLKHMDSDQHKALTGVPNEPILDNLKRLSGLGQNVIVRIPVIPGLNDSTNNLQATAKFLSGIKSLERLDLIGYHDYSVIKYKQLGRPYPLKKSQANEAYLQGIKAFFDNYDINTQLGG